MMAIHPKKKPVIYASFAFIIAGSFFVAKNTKSALSTTYGDAYNADNGGVIGTTEKQVENVYNNSHPEAKNSRKVAFKHFDSNRIYHTEGEPERELSPLEKEQVTAVREVALTYLKGQAKEGTFVSGRYRWVGDGIEYDLSFEGAPKGVTNRVTLFQRLESPKIVRLTESHENLMVNIVITLRGRLNKYAIFLDHLVKVIIPKDPHITLTVVYFSDNMMKEAREMTQEAFSPFPTVEWTFLPVESREFSRGRGLNIGARSVKRSSPAGSPKVVFFCDVDVLMQPEFFGRCRSNAVLGRQIYYPVLFSQYNPHLIYRLHDKDIPSIQDQLNIAKESGFWRAFGFGMSCMYSSDHEAAGGFPDFEVWGSEDVILYKKFLEMDNIKVLRSPDPGLFHLYHHKECTDTSSISYVDCLYSKSLTEGSQLQLGLTLLKVHEGVDLEGILSKRFYYFWLIPYLAVFLLLSLITNALQATVLCRRNTSRGFSRNRAV